MPRINGENVVVQKPRYIVVKTMWDWNGPGQFALGPWDTFEQAVNVKKCEMFFGVPEEDLMILRLKNSGGRALCGGCGRMDIPDECPCMDPWT